MQLILNNQIRRDMGRTLTKERARLQVSDDLGKLVDSTNEQRGKVKIDFFVNRPNWQSRAAGCQLAGGSRTFDEGLSRRKSPAQLSTTAGTGNKLLGRAWAPGRQVDGILKCQGCCGGAYPKSDAN